MMNEGNPVHHKEELQAEQEQESLGQYVRSELGNTLRGFGYAILSMLTAPGREQEISRDLSREADQSTEKGLQQGEQ